MYNAIIMYEYAKIMNYILSTYIHYRVFFFFVFARPDALRFQRLSGLARHGWRVTRIARPAKIAWDVCHLGGVSG